MSRASSVMSATMRRTNGSMALAWVAVKYFLPCVAGGMAYPSPQGAQDGLAAPAAGLSAPAAGLAAPAAGLAGAGGSGGLTQTGSLVSLDAATAVGLSVAWPQAISTGTLA